MAGAGSPARRDDTVDVLVVGAGNAAFSAAHAARAGGARVLVLEKAPEDEAGGNSYYTAGAFRVGFDSVDDLVPLLDAESKALLPDADVPPYPKATFRADLDRITEGRCDPAMADVLVGRSTETVRWLHDVGLRFRLIHERQTYVVDGRYQFFGGLVLGVVGGGKGLMQQHTAAARASGVEIRYGTAATGLVTEAGRVVGVRCRDADGEYTVHAGAVVLAAGGFEANPTLRAQHLGPGWERAIVRGSPHNTGEVLEYAIVAGADRHGDWGSCHSVQWDAGAPPGGGERVLTNQLTRQSYPIGIVVNNRGERFVDEGADYRNFTYAKYGKEILAQPDGRAVQIFDAKTRPILRTLEYDSSPITGAQADTVVDLAKALDIDPDGLAATVEAFNAAADPRPFDPAVKDGKSAAVDPPKSNWATPIDTPPYYGFAVACGITFTFGGVHVDERAQVLDAGGAPIPGLFAAGELVGGLFSGNYPGGSGLTAGAVFGRLAGQHAAG